MLSFSVIDSLKKTLLVKPHPAGIPFIVGGVVATVVLMMILEELGIIGLIFTLFCVYFFRDPVRVTPEGPSLVVAPADGVVSAIDHNASLPAEIAGDDGKTYTRVSIFLSVLDVHVNRIPFTGKTVRKVYRPGKFLNADLDKASEENERCSVLIEADNGMTFGVVQIAGLIARRILNDLSEAQAVSVGSRFGIIRFGSRVDTYIPSGIPVQICVGQRAVGGETVLADIGSTGADRQGQSS
jgi:phosphatidylserine decarboxylase